MTLLHLSSCILASLIDRSIDDSTFNRLSNNDDDDDDNDNNYDDDDNNDDDDFYRLGDRS